MTGFLTPVDIANRGLQHCGVELMSDTDGFNETSDRAAQTSFCYDKLRKAELRRNVWRFAIKYAVIRPVVPVGTLDASSNPVQPTMLMSPTLWASTTTYFIGSIVSNAMGSVWVSSAPDNLNNQPGNSAYWDLYYGPVAVQPYDTTATTVYFAGDVVYVTTGNGSFVTYMSRVNSNSAVPGTLDAYSATAIYMKDSLITYLSVTYQSLVDVNVGNTPLTSPTQWTTTLTRTASADKWMALGVALAQLPLIAPIGVGPSVNGIQRTLYRLPSNFLRMAPQDPKAGSVSYLGAPGGTAYLDWDLSGQYLVTRTIGAIVLRFIGDVTNVREMDDMFCEGLGARIGYEVCPKLTQSVSKRADIASAYKTFMGEARTVNGIETGATEPPEDDYIACRV